MRLLLSFHSIAGDKNSRKKEKSLPNNIFKKQNSPKIKQQERRPRKGRHGGDRAAFGTLSLVPSKEKELQNKISLRERSVAICHQWDCFCRFTPSRVTRTAGKKKNPCQTIFSKIKTHLKLSSKSVGQGRGGMEGTVRPSQLRALVPSIEKTAKEKLKNLIKQYHWKSPAKTSRRFMKLKVITLELPLPKAPILWQYQKWDTLLQASLLPFHI